MTECAGCGVSIERWSPYGPAPKWCLPCRPTRPPKPKGTCFDCGEDFKRVGRRGALPDRCPPCRHAWRLKTQGESAKRARLDPAKRPAILAAQREVYRRRGKPPRTDEQRAKDREQYYRRVATPEGRAHMRRVDRSYRIGKKYGITVEEYDEKLSSQDGRCAICRSSDPGDKYERWHIDHDHETGTLRGLLCAHCNLGLGRFKDDPSLLMAAVDYLNLWGRPLPSP